MTGIIIRKSKASHEALKCCSYKPRTANNHRRQGSLLPTCFRGSLALATPWFWSAGLQKTVRQKDSAVLSHPLCGTLLQLSLGGNTPPGVGKRQLPQLEDVLSICRLHRDYTTTKVTMIPWQTLLAPSQEPSFPTVAIRPPVVPRS
jgi:hypothetical protein